MSEDNANSSTPAVSGDVSPVPASGPVPMVESAGYINPVAWIKEKEQEVSDFIDSNLRGFGKELTVELHNAKMGMASAVHWIKKHVDA